MKTTYKLLAGVMAVSAAMPLALLTGPVHAQQYTASHAAPRIEGFNVDEVRRLDPGVELNFDLYGTPGGTATLRIAGATRNVALTEVEPGRYEGSYTISGRDKIAARSAVTANLRVGNEVASTVLTESLQTGVGYHGTAAVPVALPKIERFNVTPVSELSPGNDLEFTVFGTPGGQADLAIDGVKGKILLQEIKSGEYTGAYTIRNRDRISANNVVTATLHAGERVTSVVLGKSLQSAAAPVRKAAVCNGCGTVEAVNRIDVKGEGNYLGTIGGGLVGALIGSQVGGGNGRTAAQVAGALGGAYAGHAIEGNVRKTSHYEVLVRLQNGSTQTMSFAAEPDYRAGDKVQIRDGLLARI